MANAESPKRDAFQIASSSADTKPGKGAGEYAADPAVYAELAKRKHWRRQLSNFADAQFKWKGLTWKTAEHAYQAAKFEQISPETFRSFALESGSALSKGTGADAQKERKIIKLSKQQIQEWDARKANVMRAIWRAKFTQHEPSREILLLTGDADLYHRAPRTELQHWTDLELLRAELRGPSPNEEENDGGEETSGEEDTNDEEENSGEAAEGAEEAEAAAEGKDAEEEEEDELNVEAANEDYVPPPAAQPARRPPAPSKRSLAAAAVPPAELPVLPAVRKAAKTTPPLAPTRPTAVTTTPPALLAHPTGAAAGAGAAGAGIALVEEEKKHSTLRFCPTCGGYLFLSSSPSSLIRQCRKCGFSQEDKQGGLVMEMRVQERSSQAYKILINEYTRQDPTLAHIRGPIKCPSASCETNTAGKERDVIPIRWDEKQLKYLYICNICGIQWRSRD